MKEINSNQIRKNLVEWYFVNKRDLPWRENMTPYRVWVSEIMLQQTRVDTVIPYFNRFINQLPTIESLAYVPEEKLLKLWEGLGYYNRVKNMQKAAIQVMDEHDGVFPKQYDQILALKGIGEYTAGAISSICFSKKTPAIDGNVLRVVSRLVEYPYDIKQKKSIDEIREITREFYTTNDASTLTQALMELGATVCVFNKRPDCQNCPLCMQCNAYQNNTVEKYPIVSVKAKRKIEVKTVFILKHHGEFGLNIRKENNVLKGMYEFMNVDQALNLKEVSALMQLWEIDVASIKEKQDKKHIFTHKEWHMKVYEVECLNKHESIRWYTKQEMESDIPMPVAFKKLLGGSKWKRNLM